MVCEGRSDSRSSKVILTQVSDEAFDNDISSLQTSSALRHERLAVLRRRIPGILVAEHPSSVLCHQTLALPARKRIAVLRPSQTPEPASQLIWRLVTGQLVL